MELTWARRAIRDLDDIESYIGRDDPGAAERWIERLITLAESLPAAPLRGRMVPQFGRGDIREVFQASYRLIYRVTDTRLEVLAVIEGHRRLPTDITPTD